MKKLFTTLVLFAVSCQLLLSQTATAPSVGDGSENAPYQIGSLENLYWLSQNSDHWDDDYIQVADIDASPTSLWDDGDAGDNDGFMPIGNVSVNFTGNYDGNGFSIEGLFINRPNTDCVGMFGITGFSIIKNISLINADISGYDDVGAIVGKNTFSSSVSNSFSSGVISGNNRCGGLVGTNSYHVQHSYSNVDLDATGHNVGGVVGSQDGGTLKNCYSHSMVYGSGNNVGGLVGLQDNNGTISYCYSTGKVEHSAQGFDIGGLVGDNTSGTVANSFWNTESSQVSSSDGGTGKTTAEMKNIATYTDLSTEGLDMAWDFMGNPNDDSFSDDLWEMIPGENNDYPVLHWQFLSLAYDVETGATLNGEQNQLVEHGEDGSAVEVVPGDGYRFVEWSDGNTDNPRTDMNIVEDIDVIAMIELVTFTSEKNAGDFYLTPNPVKDVLLIKNGSPNQKFEIIDMHGSLIMRRNINDGRVRVGELKPGMYFLKANESVFKFIIE